jgi:hypothetical protein
MQHHIKATKQTFFFILARKQLKFVCFSHGMMGGPM